MDHSIGLLLDTLHDLGIEENTIVVFTSDNGPENGAGMSVPLRCPADHSLYHFYISIGYILLFCYTPPFKFLILPPPSPFHLLLPSLLLTPRLFLFH